MDAAHPAAQHATRALAVAQLATRALGATRRGPRLLASLVALALAVAACSSPPHAGDRLVDLTGGMAPLALGVTEAAQDEHGLLLRFEAVVHADVAPVPLTLEAVGDGAVTLLTPVDAAAWDGRWPLAEPVPVLSPVHWRACRLELLEALARDAGDDAVLLRLGESEQVLLLRSDGGELVLIAPAELPSGVDIVQSLGAEEVLSRSLVAAEEYLERLGSPLRCVVFDTGDPEPSRLAAAYVELDARRLELMRFGGGAVEHGGRSVVRGADTTSTVIVHGTLVEILSRPVSTLHRLIFSVKHGVTDLVRPTDTRRLATLGGELPPLSGGPPMDIEAFEQELDRLTDSTRHEATVDLLVGGDAFFPRLARELSQAQREVDLQMFIFKTDDVGVGVADQLKTLSQDREVRVLLDGVGTSMGAIPWQPGMPPDFVPPTSMVRYLRDASDVAVRVRTALLLRADHTKLILVDDQLAFLGGMNIGREYRYDWHDLMVEVRGPILAELQREFDDDWAMAGWAGDLGYVFHWLFGSAPEPGEAPPGSYPVRVLRTRAGSSEVYRALMAAARSARERILIENAYFADDALITELVAARLRGVDVQVILPLEGNHSVMNANTVVMANVLLSRGIQVHLYPGMSHVKAAVFDDWALVGSANLDRLSLRRNQELTLASSAPEFVQELVREVFEPDIASSHQLTEPFDVGWRDRVGAILAGML